MIERRFISHELRVKKTDDGKKKIAGYATKFAPNAMSEDLGGFREQIHPNAFNKCLTANPDVRGLWNHDPNAVLGRTTAGTLLLYVDNVGLLYEIDPPDTTVARDLMVSMERGDVTQSSFGFVCTSDDWRVDIDGTYVRTVLEAELFDVSPVTFPAYPDATSGVRSEVRNMSKVSQAKLEELRASSKTAKTKSVDGIELPAECFAYVGDSSNPETWKLPIKFPGDEEKTKSHIKDALARFNQTEGIPDAEKDKVHEKIVAAAKENGIQVSEETKSAEVVNVEIRTEETPVIVPEVVTVAEVRDEDVLSCDCQCTPCVDGDCDGCVDEDCEAEYCSNCGMQANRAASAAEVEARAVAELETLQLRLTLAKLKQV